MPDWVNNGPASLSLRRNKALEPLFDRWRDEISIDVTEIFPKRFTPGDRELVPYQLAFLGRMIFSCLVDGDWRDTEAFHDDLENINRPRAWPMLGEELPRLIEAFDKRMGDLEAEAGNSLLQQLRRRIRTQVEARATRSTGVFTLTVPTGGGKTLASLGFALRHAQAHSLRRIIYVIPYTSIIEQTADVLRGILGDDLVLEHHSANDLPDARDEQTLRDQGTGWKMALAMEDWAAPVIVTTSVQFFESLHSNRPSACRKLQALAGAVIIIDEAQTLPRGLLRPCIEAIRELATNYGASIVLCTATQPALDRADFAKGFDLAGRELAPDPADLSSALRRVSLKRAGPLSDTELIAALGSTQQGLVIVNSRAHALALFRAGEAADLDGLVHLTTRQHPKDRRAILAAVRQRLTDKLPCRLVATSLVEAGVDIDFPQVWRAVSGLDQIAQAAGRCNREGKQRPEDSIVTVFRPADHRTPPELDALAQAFERVAETHADPFSPAALRDYFTEVYWRDGNGLDAKGFFRGSEAHFKISGTELDFAYRRCAEQFRMIESTQVPVFIPGDDPQALAALEELADYGVRPSGPLKRLVPFTVPVFPANRIRLLDSGQVACVAEQRFGARFCKLLDISLYSTETGLLWEQAGELSIDASII